MNALRYARIARGVEGKACYGDQAQRAQCCLVDARPGLLRRLAGNLRQMACLAMLQQCGLNALDGVLQGILRSAARAAG